MSHNLERLVADLAIGLLTTVDELTAQPKCMKAMKLCFFSMNINASQLVFLGCIFSSHFVLNT